MVDARIQDGIVTVEGRPFARFALEPVTEPWKYYGCPWVVRIWPTLDRQREPGWSEQFQQVRELIRAHLAKNWARLRGPRGTPRRR
jgi:hypothetical protein